MIHEKVMCCIYRKKFTRWPHHSVSFENIGGPVVGGPQVRRGCDEIKCCNMSLFLMDTSWPWMVFDVIFLGLISERSQVFGSVEMITGVQITKEKKFKSMWT